MNIMVHKTLFLYQIICLKAIPRSEILVSKNKSFIALKIFCPIPFQSAIFLSPNIAIYKHRAGVMSMCELLKQMKQIFLSPKL